MKLKIHSVIDLITNSSTEIFTRSNNSLEACKEMLNEILALLNIEKKCDDIFCLNVLLDGVWLYEYEAEKHNLTKKDCKKLIEDIVCGKEEKPQWFIDVETSYDQNDTTLHIHSKDPKYENLISLINKFLYSTESGERYD
jgi:hypothetical protein